MLADNSELVNNARVFSNHLLLGIILYKDMRVIIKGRYESYYESYICKHDRRNG